MRIENLKYNEQELLDFENQHKDKIEIFVEHQSIDSFRAFIIGVNKYKGGIFLHAFGETPEEAIQNLCIEAYNKKQIKISRNEFIQLPILVHTKEIIL